jgi:cytoskeletal protein RodZ
MQTVGELLKETRQDKKIPLEDVEKATKIRRKYLEAIESGDYGTLPSATAARGFIKNYGKLVGIPSDTLMALLRRDYVETNTGLITPRGMVVPLDQPSKLRWTPSRTVILVVGLTIVTLGGYLFFQLSLLTANPSLAINAPLINQSFDSHTVVVAGTADPEATVYVNGQLADIDKTGAFKLNLDLPSGKNLIIATATSKSNKVTKVTRMIYVK